MSAFLSDLADSIARMEGYFPGTRAWRNNNPGNLWDGSKSIWPELPHDERGFVIFPTPEAGRAALERDLSLKVSRGWSLERLLTAWAPPSENDTAAYIRNVSAWLGIPADVNLRSIANGWGADEPGVSTGGDLGLIVAAVAGLGAVVALVRA